MNETPARVPFAACPLCQGQDAQALSTHDCSRHPLFRPPLPSSMRWVRCSGCEHVFTDGYFNQAALDLLFSRTHPDQTPGHDPSGARAVAAPIVEAISALRGSLAPTGRWLDVGFGSGGLLCTAEEYGYEVVGLDLRKTSVLLMRELGLSAHCLDLQDYQAEVPFDVISMADVLEHMPQPRLALSRAHALLAPDGLLFLSMPNIDSFIWRTLDHRRQNPYWAEIEHYHNFGRRRLYSLLSEHGFSPCRYGISGRYIACMEIIARKETP